MSEDHADRIGAIHRELHSHLPSEPALRVKALESLLVEKGMLDPKTVDAWIEVYTEEIGPKRGAEVVARAWTDPAFKERLLADGTAAITEIGFEGWAGGHLNVVPEHAVGAQPRRLHALLLLPAHAPRHPAQLVQGRRLPLARGARSARRRRRVRRGACPTTSRCGSGTPPPSFATSCSPSGLPGTEGWDVARLAGLVTRNAMIGTERDLARRMAG